MDVEFEIKQLKLRMGDLESAMGVLVTQLGSVHPELKSLGVVAQVRFDALDATMSRVFARLDTMNTQVWSLRDDMPILIAEAINQSRHRRSLD